METPRLNLPLIAAGQAQKHVPANESFKRLDALMNIAVISMAETDPPGEPDEGDMYIAASGATGAWENGDLNLFLFTDGIWLKIVPFEGLVVWDRDTSAQYVWSGASWLLAGVETLPLAMAKAPPEMTWVDDDEIQIAAGKCRDEDDTTNIVLPSPITIDNISEGNDAHRHVLVGRDGSGDPAATLSETIALPGSWQAYRRIGSIRTTASGDVRRFIQHGDSFSHDFLNVLNDNDVSDEYRTVNLPVPLGLRVHPNLYLRIDTNGDSEASRQALLSPFEVDWSIAGAGQFTSGDMPLRDTTFNSILVTDTSGRIKYRTTPTSGVQQVSLVLYGWIDSRGRDK